MNPEAYLEMAETESRHWWFCGRRTILAEIISCLQLRPNATVLEVGCGTGGNLQMLAGFCNVKAFEMDANAREIACKKTNNLYDIQYGCCPNEIPFSDQHLDLICMFDVLEHIEQDVETLISLRKLLAEKGRILLTVPAYQWLWSAHDEFLHHKRRYSASQLHKVVLSAGLQPVKISYFNIILFPLVAIARLKDKLLGNTSITGTGIPPAFINHLLRVLFSAERFLLKHCDLPFGVSLLCVLKSADGLQEIDGALSAHKEGIAKCD